MSESKSFETPENSKELRSLALTPTWSVATVLTVFVVVSLLVERSIHRLCNWLKKTDRKPLLAAVEKMKEELMLLGFISLLLTATSSIISNICIPSKFYDSVFAPCKKSDIEEENENEDFKERKLLMDLVFDHPLRRMLNSLNKNTCPENHEPFVSYEGLEQLHRFIFVMAITHISYSCLTMLLAIVKIHTWRVWEDEAHTDRHGALTDRTRAMTMRRQSTFVRVHTSNPMSRNSVLIWVTCFFRQFGRSVVRADYLSLRKGFIMNHNLTSKYDFHSYMIRSMEEEFQRIVGVSAPLWGFVVAFMMFNVKGSNLYFWIALFPITLVLLVGTKLQHVIATLALESAGITGYLQGAKLKPRDELFWFKKPELLLSLIHFVLFQNAFELASFFWFWWQFGYNSCFILNHTLVYLRLILGLRFFHVINVISTTPASSYGGYWWMATAAKAPVYVSWDEVCLSTDKGRKEVHYYLKRRDGLSDLAVVGTEKGMRNISYHYAIKGMSLLSASNSSSLSKLRTRREVVDWLNSIVSVADLRHHRDIRDDGQPCEGTDAVLNDMNTLKDVHLRRQGQHVTEFMWLGSPWTCRKKRCHYTSFCRNGVRISVHDFVYVLAEEDKRLVAYLDDMYEDTRGNRMVVVRWFHKIDEVGILLPHNYNDREILFSLCLQNLSIECVDGQATVLSPQHYERFLNDVRHTQSELFVCQKLFDNDDLKPFDITTVKGYWNQELLKHMSFSSPLRAQPSPLGELKVEDRVTGSVGSRPNKRLRISKESNISSQSVPQKGPAKACQEYCNGSSVATMEIRTLKEGCFDGSLSGKVVTEKPQQNFDIGSEVEILSQDSGIRGCWFRALVIKKHNNKVKVQYKDVKDAEDEAKNLEEWILATKLAASDKLGIRIHGRTVLRPSPSSYKGRVSWVVNVGAIVDAWWNEGWWEGIVVRKESEDRLHIYFPGEKETHIFGHSDLRHSQEWLADGWKHLKERRELVPLLLGDSTVKQTVKESSDVILEHTTCSNGVHLRTEKPRDEVASGNTDADAGERLKVLEGVHDLSKDNRLAELRWKTSGKRRRCRSPVNKVRLRFERNRNVVTKGTGMQIKETLFIPSSLKVDPDNCKYITDSLFNSSVVSPLPNLVMSR